MTCQAKRCCKLVLHSIGAALELRPDQLQALQAAFRAVDRNHNGFISPAELKSICHQHGLKVRDADILRVIQAVDLNHDGAISYNEYIWIVMEIYKLAVRQAIQASHSSSGRSINRQSARPTSYRGGYSHRH
ncbi:unnamed protein product [Didymodactylos carnosus]|uniref:EF-hand domain-containing protein n=1 Tax=Didymodactylos carnosus TaxID=1234261 RepID=A0A814PGR5_9BILA|nr:unnamed protein product [Didymodactylos carnosus]CAF1291175.1 unnamed protein product [Didymodactylos carnosus]CAF3869303.1 unnamed protein product [Didymodactylos carnosus]CAF4095894.1 unnamed protein product [Didymodactylos carnosus]